MKLSGIYIVIGLTIPAQAEVTNGSLATITTNWVVTTNWVQAPASYRMLNDKLHDANQPPWQTITFTPSHYWNASFHRFAKPVNGSSGLMSIVTEANQPSQLPAETKTFRLSSVTAFTPGLPTISTTVSNVPLTTHDLFDGGAAGLSRTLNIRAFPVNIRTNMVGFKIDRIYREYDFGLPYGKKIPVVNKKAVLTTNVVKTAADRLP